MPNRPSPGTSTTRGAEFEFRFGVAGALVLAAKIGIVAAGELGDFLLDLTGEIGELARLRRREHERCVLGADDMVGRHHAALAVVGKLSPIHVAEDLRPGAEGHDEARRLAAWLVGGQCHGATDDRRDLGDLRQLGIEAARLEHDRPSLSEPRLGKRHHLDHALVGLARRGTEGEDAVLVQDQAFDVRVLLVDLGRGLGEAEARRDIGHDAHAPVIDLAGERLAVRLIDEAQHRGGMGMIDEFMRQEGVQQRLDRRVRRAGIKQIEALDVDHCLVVRVHRARGASAAARASRRAGLAARCRPCPSPSP